MSGVYACVSDRRRLTGLSVWDCNNHSAYFSCSTQACQLSDPYWRQETYYTSAAQKHLFHCNFTARRCVLTCVCVCDSSSVCSIQYMLFYTWWYKLSACELFIQYLNEKVHELTWNSEFLVCPRFAFMTALFKWHELNMFSKK